MLIRPKTALNDVGNYRESRYFTAWTKIKQVEDFHLPQMIQEVTGQFTVPIGDAIIQTKDAAIGNEVCEELWSPLS